MPRTAPSLYSVFQTKTKVLKSSSMAARELNHFLNLSFSKFAITALGRVPSLAYNESDH